MTDTPRTQAQSPPLGSWKAAVREDQSDGRPFFSVTSSRLYRTDDGWRSNGSFGLNDLPHLALLAHRAHRGVEDLAPDSREQMRFRGSLPGPPSYE